MDLPLVPLAWFFTTAQTTVHSLVNHVNHKRTLPYVAAWMLRIWAHLPQYAGGSADSGATNPD